MEDEIAELRNAIEAIRQENVRVSDSHRAIEAKMQSLRQLVEATLADLDKAGGNLLEITAASRNASRVLAERAQESADDAAILATGRVRALTEEADQLAWNFKAYLSFARHRLESIVGVRDKWR